MGSKCCDKKLPTQLIRTDCVNLVLLRFFLFRNFFIFVICRMDPYVFLVLSIAQIFLQLIISYIFCAFYNFLGMLMIT